MLTPSTLNTISTYCLKYANLPNFAKIKAINNSPFRRFYHGLFKQYVFFER